MSKVKTVFKVKKIDVEAGGKSIVVLNNEDAADLDLSLMDRVRVRTDSKEAVALVDLSEKYIKKGEVGCFISLSEKLKLRNKQKVFIEPIEKPRSVEFIKKKLDGHFLEKEEVKGIINDVME